MGKTKRSNNLSHDASRESPFTKREDQERAGAVEKPMGQRLIYLL